MSIELPSSSLNSAHRRFWPPGVPHTLDVSEASLSQALAERAAQTPDEAGLHFLGRTFTWRELNDQADALAGALQGLGVRRGDRVLMFMQNCPQFVIAFHSILRAGAVVVPVNPMNKADELGHYIRDPQARVALVAADIAAEMAKASDGLPAPDRLQHMVVLELADALPTDDCASADSWPVAWRECLTVRRPRPAPASVQVHEWVALVAQGRRHSGQPTQGSDLAVMPYTSGTTGLPKGCMHTHATLMHNVLAAAPWLDMRAGDTVLIVVPMFHITGMVMGMLAAIRHGCTIVLLPRWDRDQAAAAIGRYRVTHWPNIPTMVIDLLAAPELDDYDLSSLRYIGGGGAPMPDAVAARLHEQLGLTYIEGYGLTETAAPTHTNPRGAAKRNCLGIPYISTQARVIDPDTLKPVPTGEVGEIVVCGPQVFIGYWRQPEATAQAFIELDGERFFRTGDLGRVDADGYFFMADRLKRMINASGFKVWPAEVEALLHHHPAVQEVCVIATRDPYRGESVKAVIVPRASHRADLTEQAIMDWAREHMAAYKYPRSVEFVEALPRNATGKLMWRTVQTQQDARDAAAYASVPEESRAMR